jgi:hypothetical protein
MMFSFGATSFPEFSGVMTSYINGDDEKTEGIVKETRSNWAHRGECGGEGCKRAASKASVEKEASSGSRKDLTGLGKLNLHRSTFQPRQQLVTKSEYNKTFLFLLTTC